MTRFLIVDDSPTIRYQLTEILMHLGASQDQIFTAEDGSQAIRVFPETKPDIVFMDINMPNQDGVQAAQALFKMQPNLKIVVMTGMSRGDPAPLRLISEGAYAFLQKPLEQEDVKRVLRKMEMGEGGTGRITSSG